jgi:23S rRNA pseudouridine1911/1915/1917 synthase
MEMQGRQEETDEQEEDPSSGDAVEQRLLLVPALHHGDRLDKVLAIAVPEFSRSYLQQLIEAGLVRRDGRPVAKPATRVFCGDRLEVELRPTQQSQAFLPESMALDIVHQDDHLLVLHKPAGLVTHPAPGNWSGTLLNGLLAHDAQAARLPRAGIVHRLDKDTSGLMVVARSRLAMDALVRAIAAREVRRQYVALAHRPWSGAKHRELDMPIGRDPRNRLRMAVVDLQHHAGKTARTTADLLVNGEAGCLVQCTLHTGRTHQIRVHLAKIGHPLVADALYGGAPAAGMRRQALHAFRLAFTHPVTGQSLSFEAAPPPDLQRALEDWGLHYNPV